jgi:hypothetical protein
MSAADPWDALIKNNKKDPPDEAIAQLAELIASRDKALPGRPAAGIDVCIRDARDALRAALTTAGFTEYRAMVTAEPGHAAAHAAALTDVDAAYATLWAYEAAGAKIRVHDVHARRVELLESIERLGAKKRAAMAPGGSPGGGAELVSVIEELRRTHQSLVQLSSLTEAEVRLPRPASSDASFSPPPTQTPKASSVVDAQQASAKSAAEVRKRLRKNGRVVASSGGGRTASSIRLLRARALPVAPF